jgi:protein-S-isoprenylcysteine O-methyltransferase Ste14
MELGRRGDTGIVLAVFLPGLFMFSAGSVIAICAMIRNVFFEITARIQDDRDQTVVSCGPYRVIRHPGYLSFILDAVSLPLLTGSRNAWACAAVLTIIIVLRTKFEDGMLLSRLPGYRDYARLVRWRLVPLVW